MTKTCSLSVAPKFQSANLRRRVSKRGRSVTQFVPRSEAEASDNGTEIKVVEPIKQTLEDLMSGDSERFKNILERGLPYGIGTGANAAAVMGTLTPALDAAGIGSAGGFLAPMANVLLQPIAQYVLLATGIMGIFGIEWNDVTKWCHGIAVVVAATSFWQYSSVGFPSALITQACAIHYAAATFLLLRTEKVQEMLSEKVRNMLQRVATVTPALSFQAMNMLPMAPAVGFETFKNVLNWDNIIKVPVLHQLWTSKILPYLAIGAALFYLTDSDGETKLGRASALLLGILALSAACCFQIPGMMFPINVMFSTTNIYIALQLFKGITNEGDLLPSL